MTDEGKESVRGEDLVDLGLMGIKPSRLAGGLGYFTSDLSGYLLVAEHTRPGDIPYTMGDWDGQNCPDCGTETLSNSVGERWCAMSGCRFIA